MDKLAIGNARPESFPFLLEAGGAIDPHLWMTENRDEMRAKLLQNGAMLLRNFNIPDVRSFESFIQILFGDLLEYKERSSPRSRISGNTYTSTEYPADQEIFLHNENSYQKVFPLKIAFFCVTPAARGGDTPIADVRKVYKRISSSTREKFSTRKVMYVRNFRDSLGLSWQNVFQTDSKDDVERYCQTADIQTEWGADGSLKTRQVRPAIAAHPVSGDLAWFNHATFFHVSTLPSMVRDMLLSEFAEDELPANTYYGDGEKIESEVMEELRLAYRSESVSFPWKRGDVLVLENMLVAHGRHAFQGDRKVAVGMAEPYSISS